jgi:hypothetical protein
MLAKVVSKITTLAVVAIIRKGKFVTLLPKLKLTTTKPVVSSVI